MSCIIALTAKLFSTFSCFRVLIGYLHVFFLKKKIYIYIYIFFFSNLAASGFSCAQVPEHVGSVVAARCPTRDGIHISCIGRRVLNHWTTWEVPLFVYFLLSSVCSSLLCIFANRVVFLFINCKRSL